MRRVVRRDGDADPVAREHADVEASHAARELGSNELASLVDLDAVLAAAEGVYDCTFELEEVAATHVKCGA